ncbi:MAG: hypothetical protein L6416_03710 [Candidatus Omnitrophica bacterium]|nr:hypothetical protein [Candidatus Omnitrophota bacterium]
MKKLILVILAIILLSSNVFASEEGVLKLSNFIIKSDGIGDSGAISVTGIKNQQNEFIDLKIAAFDKEYKILEEDLKKIPSASYNGIQLSYVEGYKEFGGKTIYIIFQRGFTSGINKKVLITLSENGSVSIKEMKN